MGMGLDLREGPGSVSFSFLSMSSPATILIVIHHHCLPSFIHNFQLGFGFCKGDDNFGGGRRKELDDFTLGLGKQMNLVLYGSFYQDSNGLLLVNTITIRLASPTNFVGQSLPQYSIMCCR